MAVANKQVAIATNSSENLRRLAATAPDARNHIRIIWTSPLIPLDPLVWRKDFGPAVKTKLYTWIISYGRIGSDSDIEKLPRACWPISSRPRLLRSLVRQSIRSPSGCSKPTRTSMKPQADEKLSADEKARQIATIRADIEKLEEMQKKAEFDQFQKRGGGLYRGRQGWQPGGAEQDDRRVCRRLLKHPLTSPANPGACVCAGSPVATVG